MDEKENKEYPSIEETLYRLNGTLMNIDKSINVLGRTLDKCNWNFGNMVKKMNEK